MAFPTEIDTGTRYPIGNLSRLGPFQSGGATYVVAVDLTTAVELQVWKATDPEDGSFSEQDAGNSPIAAEQFRQVSVWQEGTDLHIGHYDNSLGALGIAAYTVFHMATDLYDGTINDELIEDTNAGGDGSSREAIALALRSDGDVIVAYSGEIDKVHGVDYERVDYAREEGSGWTFGIAVDNGGEFNWSEVEIVRGSNDRMHFFFQDTEPTARRMFQRTLVHAGNALETFPAVGDDDLPSIGVSNGMSYDDGGTQRVRVGYRDTSTNISLAEIDSVDAPGAFAINADVSDEQIANDQNQIALAANGTDEHLLYIEVVDRDIWHKKNADADVAITSGLSVGNISSNVYTRDSVVRLGFVYSASGDLFMDEIDLVAAPAEIIPDLHMAQMQPAA